MCTTHCFSNMLNFLWVTIPKYFFLGSTVLFFDTNFINILFWGRHTLYMPPFPLILKLKINVFCVWFIHFLFIHFLLVYDPTYEVFETCPNENYLSVLLLHTIWVVCLYNVPLLYWLGMIGICYCFHYTSYLSFCILTI